MNFLAARHFQMPLGRPAAHGAANGRRQLSDGRWARAPGHANILAWHFYRPSLSQKQKILT